MGWTNHPIEPDLYSIEGDGHVVVYGIIPAITTVIGIGRTGILITTVSAMSPTTANIVELVEASALDTIIDGYVSSVQ